MAVRGSKVLLNDIGKSLSEFLVCPLSKQPLRVCPETGRIVSDAIGVSFPVVDGIPCLVPKDGKLVEDADNADTSSSDNTDKK